jgi:mono/diheme cytochrome c family protein
MRRLRLTVLSVPLLLGLAGLWLTRPEQLPDDALQGLTGDTAAGELIFAAAGCGSCHHTSDTPTPEEGTAPHLGGGRSFVSDFGTFYAPNISPDPTHGIGTWQREDLANALLFGTSPERQHYYPAFPYTAYKGMALQDIADLWAYLSSLPADSTPNRAHDVGFPFSIRSLLGGWKRLYGAPQPDLPAAVSIPEQRGTYLVEVLGHCAECHTPRNAFGGLITDQWMGGAPNPSGQGRIPNITPAALDWSEADLVEYLTSGFTPDFDSAGGEMVEVIENLAKLPERDRMAIAVYLKKLPPVQ